VNRYLIRLAPKTDTVETDPITGRKITKKLSILVRYARIMKLIEDKKDTTAMRKHREELFGGLTPIYGSPRYTDLSVIHAIGIPPTIWREMNLDEQAQQIARHYLESMIDTITRHDNIVRRNEEKNKKKT